jgi:hypothetical protein
VGGAGGGVRPIEVQKDGERGHNMWWADDTRRGHRRPWAAVEAGGGGAQRGGR